MLTDWQKNSIQRLLSQYMLNKFWSGVCPFDSVTVATESSFGLKVHSANCGWDLLTASQRKTLLDEAMADLEQPDTAF